MTKETDSSLTLKYLAGIMATLVSAAIISGSASLIQTGKDMSGMAATVSSLSTALEDKTRDRWTGSDHRAYAEGKESRDAAQDGRLDDHEGRLRDLERHDRPSNYRKN